MNINSKLSKFAQEELVLARSSNERDRINGSLSQLEYVLSNKLDIKEFLRFGSYTRNTILPRKYYSKSDVDLLVVFNTLSSSFKPNTYRKQIHQVLDHSYPNSISKKDFPAVKLELNHIMFDIVPSQMVNSFFYGYNYYIPDSGNDWCKTYPNDLNSEISKKNQSYGGNIIRQVIRLCKHWNATSKYPLESYLMEKEIIQLWYWGNENTYERFLKTLNSIAGNRPGVRQALDNINYYKGGFLREPDIEKQWLWLKKLLPGLK
jgi:predicted nucleotidyltransferase